MEIFIVVMEGIKYALPAALLLIAVKIMNDTWLKREKLRESGFVKSELLKSQLPLKISAHERAVLYLERISPQNLIPRLNDPSKSARELHFELVQEIKTEYEHNIAQQIYISNHSWHALVRAKEEMLNVINLSLSQLEGTPSGLDLSRKIIENCANQQEIPTQIAAFALKSDIQEIFRV